MKCVVNLVNLNNHVIDIDENTTLENVVEAVTERQKILLQKGCFIEIVKPDGSRNPAPADRPIIPENNGHNYFRMVATPKTSQIFLHGSFLKQNSGYPYPLPVTIEQKETVLQLKQKLEQRVGVPAALQHICRPGGQDVLDQYPVFSHGVLDKDRLYLSLRFTIRFWFEAKCYRMECLSDESLCDLLKRFADDRGRDSTELRYLIGKATGTIAECAMDWLPERDCLFETESAIGSVEENGLFDDNEIHVFRVNGKRKRSVQDREPPADRQRVNPAAPSTSGGAAGDQLEVELDVQPGNSSAGTGQQHPLKIESPDL